MARKFRITLSDSSLSVFEDLDEEVRTRLKAVGICDEPDHPGHYYEVDQAAWDQAAEKELALLEKFVTKFVDFSDGDEIYNAEVTLEFDLEAKTCVVVPVQRAKKKRSPTLLG